MLKIYNSISKKKEKFVSLNNRIVKLYLCGVTVYDYCHIGHARTYIFFDIVVRYLDFLGFKVNFIRNITDVDDKILKKAEQLNLLPEIITKQFIEAMRQDFATLNLLPPTYEPKATDHIDLMIKLINKLLINNYAYIGTNGDVFFNTKNFQNYGNLAKRDIENMQHTDRVADTIQQAKLNSQDFVLWKVVINKNELGWQSPWGYGRPGWHTECAAMSLEFLGNEFDIHGGGADLIFPHHENEIAQIESITGKPAINYWMHVGFLRINQQKMSKSLGNFKLIKDVLKVYHPEVLRYFMLSSHYRSQIEFTDHKLQVAKLSLERLYLSIRGIGIAQQSIATAARQTMATDQDNLFEAEVLNIEKNVNYNKQNTSTSIIKKLCKKEQNFKLQMTKYYLSKFQAAMDDDFNTPLALSVLFELSKKLNIIKEHHNQLQIRLDYGNLNTQDVESIPQSASNKILKKQTSFFKFKIQVITNLLIKIGNIIGLLTIDPEKFLRQSLQQTNELNVLTNDAIEELIIKRNNARKMKDWPLADAIRQELLKHDVLLEDNKGQTIWRKKSC